jgi:hypothetical protein
MKLFVLTICWFSGCTHDDVDGRNQNVYDGISMILHDKLRSPENNELILNLSTMDPDEFIHESLLILALKFRHKLYYKKLYPSEDYHFYTYASIEDKEYILIPIATHCFNLIRARATEFNVLSAVDSGSILNSQSIDGGQKQLIPS